MDFFRNGVRSLLKKQRTNVELQETYCGFTNMIHKQNSKVKNESCQGATKQKLKARKAKSKIKTMNIIYFFFSLFIELLVLNSFPQEKLLMLHSTCKFLQGVVDGKVAYVRVYRLKHLHHYGFSSLLVRFSSMFNM